MARIPPSVVLIRVSKVVMSVRLLPLLVILIDVAVCDCKRLIPTTTTTATSHKQQNQQKVQRQWIPAVSTTTAFLPSTKLNQIESHFSQSSASILTNKAWFIHDNKDSARLLLTSKFTKQNRQLQQQQRRHSIDVRPSLSIFSTPITATATSSDRSTTDSNDDVNTKKLKGVICLVTGASRGIGKGIAIELGKQGATVYITGTTSINSTTTTSTTTGLGGSIEETANEIIQVGGIGIPILCDHSNDTQVQSVFDRISEETNGQLHILVNNCFRTPYNRIDWLMKPFWEQGSAGWDPIHTVGLLSHYIATCYAMKLMFRTTCTNTVIARPVVFMISSFGGMSYTFNVPYGVGKAGVDRMVKDMSIELNSIYKKNISIISLWPGIVRTEANNKYIYNGEWEKHVKIPITNNEFYETPNFTGKAIVALVVDDSSNSNSGTGTSSIIKKSGSIQIVAEIAEEYNFYDISGTRPPSIRSLRFLLPTYGGKDINSIIPFNKIPNWKLPIWLMSNSDGPPPSASS